MEKINAYIDDTSEPQQTSLFMEFVEVIPDPEVRSKQKRDCMVRAMVNVTGVDYEEMYKAMYQHGFRKTRRLSKGAWEDQIRKPLEEYGYTYTKHSFPAVKGKPRMTARMMASGDHPHYNGDFTEGIYILRVARHLTCLKDGVLYDTYDCSDKCVYYAWEIFKTNQDE